MTLLARTLSSAQHTLQTAARIIPPSRFAGILAQFGKHTDFWACVGLSVGGFAHGGIRSYDMYFYPPRPDHDAIAIKARHNSGRMSPEEVGREMKRGLSKSPSKPPAVYGSTADLLELESTTQQMAKEAVYKLPTKRTWGKPRGLLFFGTFFLVCAYALRPVANLNPLLTRI